MPVVTFQKNTERWLPLVFLIWPLLAFILAWRIFPRGNSKSIINAFYVLYGLLFIINPEMDSQRYATFLIDANALPFNNFYTILTQLYESSVDVLLPFITFIVSRFTYDHGFLFATFALIFGIVSLGQLGYFFDLYRKRPSINALVFLCLLPWIIPVFEINGFRFWMASWVFIYGIIHYLQTKKFKYFIFTCLAIFIHFSFAGAVIVFIVWIILGNWPTLYLIAGTGTLFISELNFEAVRSYFAVLGPAFENKFASYTHEKYLDILETTETQSSWFIKLNSKLLFYFFIIKSVFIYLDRKKIKENKFAYSLLSFSLLFLCFVNISALFPSGGRFMTPYLFLICGTVFIYHTKIHVSNQLTFLNKLYLFPLILFVIVTLRIGMESINAALFLPGFLIPFGADLQIPLLDFF